MERSSASYTERALNPSSGTALEVKPPRSGRIDRDAAAPSPIQIAASSERVRETGSEAWSFEIVAGPNRGAFVVIEGEARIGTALDNDIVLADPGVEPQQLAFSLEDGVAVIHPLAPGVKLGGRPLSLGRAIFLKDGQIIQTGTTIFLIRGPAVPVRRARWLLIAAPLLLVAVGTSALIGFSGPGRSGLPPGAPLPQVASPRPSAAAAEALTERLKEVGLADHIHVTASPGAVVAEGRVVAAQLVRWSEQQVWFDSRYRGSLSLVNQVREAAPDERPNIQLRAVSFGQVPYLITGNGDRYPEGSVVDGWTIEQITPEKVVLSRNGRRAELVL